MKEWEDNKRDQLKNIAFSKNYDLYLNLYMQNFVFW